MDRRGEHSQRCVCVCVCVSAAVPTCLLPARAGPQAAVPAPQKLCVGSFLTLVLESPRADVADGRRLNMEYCLRPRGERGAAGAGRGHACAAELARGLPAYDEVCCHQLPGAAVGKQGKPRQPRRRVHAWRRQGTHGGNAHAFPCWWAVVANAADPSPVFVCDVQTLVAQVYSWRSKHTRRGVVPLVLALWDEESDRMDKEEKVHVEVHNQRRLREEEMESSQLVSLLEGVCGPLSRD